jgi:hypothetical protein
MYIGMRLRYNKVFPVCAMEGDNLSGGIAPLIFKFGPRQIRVVRLSAQANLLSEKTWSCRLGGRWSWSGCFVEEIVLLLLPRFELLIFLHISWSFY